MATICLFGGEWRVLETRFSMGMMVTPQGFIGDHKTPEPGDKIILASDAAGMESTAKYEKALPMGLVLSGPYGLDDDMYIVKKAE